MRKLRPGDPCPCCGMPIKTQDPSILLLLSAMADIMGKPVPLRCGECPVAIASEIDGYAACPFTLPEEDNLWREDAICDLEIVSLRDGTEERNG